MGHTLVRLPNWLGDVVMALPALRAVLAWPQAGAVSVALPRPLAPVARMIEGVAEVLPLDSTGTWRGPAFEADVARVRQGAFNRVVLFPNSFGSAWMMRRAGVPERWGYRADWRGPLLTRRVPRRKGRSGASPHHAHYYWHLVARLGLAGDLPEQSRFQAMARLFVDEALRDRSRQWLAGQGAEAGRPLVAFAPGAAYGHAKRWRPEHVAEVVARLVHEDGAIAMMVGSGADRDTGAAIESALRQRLGAVPAALVDAIGRTDVGLLAGVLAACAVVVSNDSGAMHVASAVGTPVVAVFGPTDERATAPLGEHVALSAPVFCRPCHLRRCPIDHRCMRRVTPEQVLAAVRRYLDRRSSET